MSVSPKVLLVDDDFEIREAVADLLRDDGYDVVVAQNGAQALEYLDGGEALPALILLDVSMPVMDGFAFRTRQKLNPLWAQIPTVMTSADTHVKERAAEMGILDYLQKPIELGDLFALVAKYCRRSLDN